MAEICRAPTWRSAAAAALISGCAFALVAGAQVLPRAADTTAQLHHLHDWDFLVGRWNVHHRRLKGWFVGSTTWDEFNGTCVDWAPGGYANVDDNLLEAPNGTYRGVTIRTFDVESGFWSIWWVDSRYPTSTVDAAVRGRFRAGEGEFFGAGVEQGRQIKWRTRWSRITPTSAHWEQATSTDGGLTWETNWIMEFSRVSA
jgi:hypothetical protein